MKCRLFKLVIFLFLGTIASIALAWLVSYSSLRSEQKWNEVPLGLDTKRVWSDYALPDWPDLHSEHKSLEIIEGDNGAKLILAYEWNQFGLRKLLCRVRKINSKSRRTENWVAREVQAGWPARCLRGGVRLTQKQNIVTDGVHAWFLPGPMNLPSTSRIFVYMPIWPGLIINCVIYAMLFYAIATGCRYCRRYVRHKRILCIKCGYDLRGTSESGCPECGRGRDETSELADCDE